jgi:DNA-binding transcriptional MerR regulator
VTSDETPHESPREELFSIGTMAELTGISSDTIRVWERRYGKPKPIRLPSGHRRYTAEHVRWLRRVAETLALGYRPSHVVSLADGAINQLLTGDAPREISSEVDAIVKGVLRFDDTAVRDRLNDYVETHGFRAFVDDLLQPLLQLTGRSWADGTMYIRHEHLLSEIVHDFLRALRYGQRYSPNAPIIALATLTGERHGLGLQMAAIIAGLESFRPLVLGAETPNAEIILAANDAKAVVVGVGVSLATGGVETDRHLGELRRSLDPAIRLVIGGQGARGVRRGPRGVDYIRTLDDFSTYLRTIRDNRAAS